MSLVTFLCVSIVVCTTIFATVPKVESPEDILIEDPCDQQLDATNVIRTLRKNRRKWRRSKRTISKCYDMTIQTNCFCFQCDVEPVDLCVKYNQIKSIEFNNPTITEPGQICENFVVDGNNYHTMDGLFAFVLNALNNGVASIVISYDSNYGYITNVFIDYNLCYADDEIGYTVSSLNFKPCEDCNSLIDPNEILPQLYEAEQKWEDSHETECYCYTISQSCFCPICYIEPKTVCVRNGVVDYVYFQDYTLSQPGGQCENFPLNPSDYWTIPEIYDFIENSVTNGVHDMQITYGDYGIPNSIFIDSIGCAIDDEISYNIRNIEFHSCCDETTNPKEHLPELEKNNQLWTKTKQMHSECYSFVFQKSCYCQFCDVQQFEVVVQSGNIISVSFVDATLIQPGGQCENWIIDFTNYLTIQDIFDHMTNALNNGIFSLDVTYNLNYGYPESVAIQWGDPQCIADAFIGFYVENVRFLRCSQTDSVEHLN